MRLVYGELRLELPGLLTVHAIRGERVGTIVDDVVAMP